MPRSFIINGESLVQVVLPAGSSLPGTNQLGLAMDAIRVSLAEHVKPLYVDAYGQNNTIDEQVFGGDAQVEMNLIHFDAVVLFECIRLAFPTSPVEGSLGRAGFRRGNALPLGTTGNSLITLNITSPVAALPFNFPAAFLADRPYEWPLGTEKSVVKCVWKAIPYAIDPWGNGTGSQGSVVYNRTALAVGNNP